MTRDVCFAMRSIKRTGEGRILWEGGLGALSCFGHHFPPTRSRFSVRPSFPRAGRGSKVSGRMGNGHSNCIRVPLCAGSHTGSGGQSAEGGKGQDNVEPRAGTDQQVVLSPSWLSPARVVVMYIAKHGDLFTLVAARTKGEHDSLVCGYRLPLASTADKTIGFTYGVSSFMFMVGACHCQTRPNRPVPPKQMQISSIDA